MNKMLIIGGSDAGISAALRIKELDAQADITMVLADAYPNFSICGLPFYISGEVQDWRSLAHRNLAEIESHGIRVMSDHRAEAILPDSKKVRILSHEKATLEVGYDKLLIATGARSAVPPIEGLDVPGVFFLRWTADSFAVKDFIDQYHPRRAVIIGGGYIGLEMADALTHLGIEVTLMEFAPEVMTTLDPETGLLIRAELTSRNVRVVTGQAVQRSVRKENSLLVETASGNNEAADMVLVATGAKPSTELARTAGIDLGAGGAIQVDRTMGTGVKDIWAAGDCGQTWHRILQRHDYLPLGTTAHKQGRVAGENMLGGKREFQGSLGTQVVKVFDQVAAGTGLRDKAAAAAGFDPMTVQLAVWDHKVYYPDAKQIQIRVTGDRGTGRLLGAQIVGPRGTEVSKRIDIFATALFHSMHVEELCDLDLSYTPPLSSPWDPIQMVAMQWCAQQNNINS
jgi:NADPH-dependent 2,4-dienoyl-CoA reductase/sulfur reductase-like enzyme